MAAWNDENVLRRRISECCPLLQDREEPVGSSDTVEVLETGEAFTGNGDSEAKTQQINCPIEQAWVVLYTWKLCGPIKVK